MKLTMSQALVQFLKNQFVERDNKKNAFFSGVWGIFGHGNVTGIGQALEQDGELKHFFYHPVQQIGFLKIEPRPGTWLISYKGILN